MAASVTVAFAVVLLAGGCDKTTSGGAETGQEGGEKPPVTDEPDEPAVTVSLEITENYTGARPYAETSHLIVTENASSIECALIGSDLYEKETGDGLTEEEIIGKYGGGPLSGSQTGEANGRGFTRTDKYLTPATGYIFLAMASGDDGEPVVRTVSSSTDDYLPESLVEYNWKTVSTNGYMECGLFRDILKHDGEPVTSLPFSGLTVQRLSDKDVFRVQDPFREFWASQDGDTAGGDKYIMVDARDAGAVKVEWWSSRPANYLGIIYEGHELYIQSSRYTGAEDGLEALGTYDPDAGTVYFGDIKVLSEDRFYSNAAPTRLWFENPYPVEPDPDKPGFSTEDFEIVHTGW